MALPNSRWLASLHTLLAVVVLAGLPFGLLAGAKKPKQHSMTGFTIAVQLGSITILDKTKTKPYTFLTDQDYTSRLGIGAKLTVHYTVENGVNHLQSMDPPEENFLMPADAIRSQIRKIIILPDPQVPDSQGIIDRIGQYLTASLGWFVAPSTLAEEIRDRAKQSGSPLDEIDPKTGQFNMARYLQDQSSLISKLVAETRVDALLEVEVVEVKAPVKKNVARWDGTSEVIAGKRTRMLGMLAGLPNSGWVLASTVAMKLWTPQGKLLWSCRRGFAALGYQTGVGYGYRQRPLADVYQDRQFMSDWLASTLGSLAPPPPPKPIEIFRREPKPANPQP